MKKILPLLLLFLMFYNASAQNQGKNGKPYDFVQGTTDRLTKMLALDGFQAAAIKNFIEEYKKDIESIGPLQIPAEAKKEKYTIASDKMESKIFSVLNKDQIQKYKDEKDKKEKKTKKGKDKKEDLEMEIKE